MNPFDIQVNGYAGINFNEDGLTPDQFREACVAMREDGVSHFLPTVITDHIPQMCGRLQAIVAACEADPESAAMVPGIHIEGPFISTETGYPGAHPIPAIKAANVEDTKQLLDACQGLCKLITLAPEQDESGKVTQFLTDQGIVVSAGHTNASLDQLKRGIDHGLSMVTHLGNGCPLTMHRHDNIVQRSISLADKLWLCFIPDGVHVEFFALANYLRAAGLERCIAVTDAMHAARLGPGTYSLAGWELNIGEDLVARIPSGNLAGSTVTMPRLTANLREHLGLSEGEIEMLVDANPRKALGI